MPNLPIGLEYYGGDDPQWVLEFGGGEDDLLRVHVRMTTESLEEFANMLKGALAERGDDIVKTKNR